MTNPICIKCNDEIEGSLMWKSPDGYVDPDYESCDEGVHFMHLNCYLDSQKNCRSCQDPRYNCEKFFCGDHILEGCINEVKTILVDSAYKWIDHTDFLIERNSRESKNCYYCQLQNGDLIHTCGCRDCWGDFAQVYDDNCNTCYLCEQHCVCPYIWPNEAL